MGPVHWRVLALVTSGYFPDELGFAIFSAFVPDLIKRGFVIQAWSPRIENIALPGLGIAK